jgi:hypothetical protein
MKVYLNHPLVNHSQGQRGYQNLMGTSLVVGILIWNRANISAANLWGTGPYLCRHTSKRPSCQ